MQKTLDEMDERFCELEELIQQPEVIKNSPVYTQYLKEHGALSRVVNKYRELKAVRQEKEEAELLATDESDPEMKELALSEKEQLEQRAQQISAEIQDLVIFDEDEDKRNVIVEIRAGTGGEEASLFSQELLFMYTKFAEKKRWRVEMLDVNRTELGGIKEAVFAIRGKDAYRCMKYESGGHRVQRVPVTESGGRIHTSAATVAVLPEAESVDVEINPNDLKIDFMRASGPGGQNVNKTSSAVRITHMPSGIVVSCQDTPEQHKNKMKAMRILRTRLLQRETELKHQERNELRREQHGTGDRNERIRTYNFPQNRVTDHRINLSVYNLQETMQGDLDEFVEKLQEQERERRLQEIGNIF